MKEKTNIIDIASLSDAILEIIKEISKSGNVLSNVTLPQFLSKEKKIKDMIKLANEAQKMKLLPAKKINIEELLEQNVTDEEKEKQSRKQIVKLDEELDRERDFNKRVVLVFLNLCRISGNEPFFELLDEYKKLVIDETDLERRESILTAINNQMLKEDISSGNETGIDVEDINEEPLSKRSIFDRFLGKSSEVKLKSLKKVCLKSLKELQLILGGNFESAIAVIRERINSSEDIDYLFSLRKQIIGLIEKFVQDVQRDREQVTEFVKVIGKKLFEMEEQILVNFSFSHQSLEEDIKFHQKLEDEIGQVGKSIGGSKSFDEIKSLIITELAKINIALEVKRKEYASRIEKSDKEKEKLQEDFGSMINNVIEQNKSLIEQNQKDSLTGIYNRATFEEFINVELQRYHRYKDTFSIIMFDIDYFKNVNDEYGHAAGDRVLKGISKCIRGFLRKADIFARYGGEEFIILLPQTGLDKGLNVAQKLREVIQDTEFIYENVRVLVTVSVGVTEVIPSDREYKSLFNRVDKYMYQGKERGRNLVISDLDAHIQKNSKEH